MGMADVCRVCLSGRRRLHPVNNTVFQDAWERLTHAKFSFQFNANDGRPLLVCYMCCAQLRKSHQLMKRALTAEELFTDIINNDHCEQSQITLIFLASQTKIFNDKYVIQNVHHLDSNQSERNTVNEIKKEDEGESISIKEEREDSRQDENLDGADVESGTSSDDDVESGASSDDYSLLKKILETEVRIVLEKIDIGAQTRKRTLNEEAKRTKLNETLTDRNPLADTASRNLPTNNCKASSDLSLSKYLSADSNVGIYKNKEINCEQLNTASTELNILQKHKIQVENVIVLNSQTLTSKVCYSNAENENIGLSKSADMVAPSTSLHRIDEGNKTNSSEKKESENKLSCHVCKFKCATKNILNIHLRKHTEEKLYMCDLCDFRSLNKSHLTNHIKYKHTNEKNFSCHMSRYKCVTKKELNTHLRKDTAEKPYICDLCDYRCSGLSNLRRHITCKHTNEGTLARPYKCNLCDYRCSHNSNLKSHIKFKHTNEKNFSCDMCQYKCVNKNELIRHLRKHTGDKPYECHLCDYRCSDPSCLRSHIKYKHTNEKNFSCHMCQYKCVIKKELNIHLRKHTGEKPYICDLCDYRCSDSSNLRRHIKCKHTNEGVLARPYKCDLCDYRCSLNGNLKSHIKFKHKNEKNFSCHMCQYKFVTKNQLNIHLRKHTGEKPYKCDLCDYRSAQNGHLRRHIKAHKRRDSCKTIQM